MLIRISFIKSKFHYRKIEKQVLSKSKLHLERITFSDKLKGKLFFETKVIGGMLGFNDMLIGTSFFIEIKTSCGKGKSILLGNKNSLKERKRNFLECFVSMI